MSQWYQNLRTVMNNWVYYGQATELEGKRSWEINIVRG